jgi:flagellar basal-body rod protein FlgB
MKVNDFLFKGRVPLLNKSLDAYALRMTTSAKNISNIDTVGYKPQKVKFEELFNDQMISLQGAKTNERHIPLGKNPNPDAQKADAKIPAAEIMNSGDNDVNIDKEMSQIAETQIRFQFASQSMSKYFKQLSAAITGNSNF